jgi:5-methylcytosine-specific restriction endonuclease McrA
MTFGPKNYNPRHYLRPYPPMVIPAGLETWTDHAGQVWRTPRTISRLKFSKNSTHRALRAFVFVRDGFTCQECGAKPGRPPKGYDGSTGVSLPGRTCLVMDHIVSRRNGEIHHPTNLRTVCYPCNTRKIGLSDIPAGRELQGARA